MLTIASSLESMSAAEIAALCARRAQALMSEDDWASLGMAPDELATRCTAIILRNLKSGRAQRVIGKQKLDSSQAAEYYVDRVVTTFIHEHPRVARLGASNEDEWRRLFVQLFHYAQNMLRRYDSHVDSAADFAQQTCESIYIRIFPCDVKFNAWAGLILKNHIRLKRFRSRDPLDGSLSLDHTDRDGGEDDPSPHDRVADPSSDSLFDRSDLHNWLLDAIQRLSSRKQQDVIVLGHFYAMSDEEIARHLNCSVQAVHSLRHRALKNLRKILGLDPPSNSP